jgi:hypothetical protein
MLCFDSMALRKRALSGRRATFSCTANIPVISYRIFVKTV